MTFVFGGHTKASVYDCGIMHMAHCMLTTSTITCIWSSFWYCGNKWTGAAFCNDAYHFLFVPPSLIDRTLPSRHYHNDGPFDITDDTIMNKYATNYGPIGQRRGDHLVITPIAIVTDVSPNTGRSFQTLQKKQRCDKDDIGVNQHRASRLYSSRHRSLLAEVKLSFRKLTMRDAACWRGPGPLVLF